MRYILHSDLNNFYASVECLYHPEIRNNAVVVVGDEEKRHGIVLAKNYIAKQFGVKTGDTVWEAKVKCGGQISVVTARFLLYQKVSKMVKDIYREYSDRVESFGIDEAWIDITQKVHNFKEAYEFAEMLRKRIVQEIGITVSIGVSYNKIFAKLGSDMKKPNATTVITPQNYKSLVWKLPAEELLMVGKATKLKLQKNGIYKIGDICNSGISFMKKLLGKNGETLYNFACGLDESEVKLNYVHEKIKSIGNSTTCPRDLKTLSEVETVVYIMAENVAKRMREEGVWGCVVSMWYKDGSLASFEKQKQIGYPTNLAGEIGKVAFELFCKMHQWQNTVRAVGVRVSALCEEPTQENLFVNYNNIKKKEMLEKAVEEIRSRFGYQIIRRANVKATNLLDVTTEDPQHTIHPLSYLKGTV